jgi:hypothetical protein
MRRHHHAWQFKDYTEKSGIKNLKNARSLESVKGLSTLSKCFACAKKLSLISRPSLTESICSIHSLPAELPRWQANRAAKLAFKAILASQLVFSGKRGYP